MDASAVNWNVTIDDFDSILTYEDQGIWQTPDPSAPGFNPGNSTWLSGTYHETSTKDASVSLNITGPALYIYGGTGSSYGSYEIQIDNVSSQHSAYRNSSGNKSSLLYAATNLTYAHHNVVIRNLGARSELGDKGGDNFTLDYIHSTIQLAPAGATVSNVTYEETNPALKYTGIWGNNTGPVFSGGGTAYTNGDLASVSLSFNGSAIYVLGDKKNNHRIYGVTLDNQPTEFYNGTSGCGGAYGLGCEQQHPTLKFLASNLNGSLHTLKIENHAGVNNSFFDLDSIVVTVPSTYAPRQLTNSSSPFTTASTSPGASTTSGGGTTGSGNSTSSASLSLSMMSNPLMLLVFLVLFSQVRSKHRR